jgi:hypothetical protein
VGHGSEFASRIQPYTWRSIIRNPFFFPRFVSFKQIKIKLLNPHLPDSVESPAPVRTNRFLVLFTNSFSLANSSCLTRDAMGTKLDRKLLVSFEFSNFNSLCLLLLVKLSIWYECCVSRSSTNIQIRILLSLKLFIYLH